jgi:hypothetical protein
MDPTAELLTISEGLVTLPIIVVPPGLLKDAKIRMPNPVGPFR